jgi:hypothetical protein
MTTPRITRAQAAEHFAKNVAGKNPPLVQALLDVLWSGNQPPAEPAEEVVVPMGQRIGFTDLMTMDLDIDWKTAAAPAPATPIPGNRKARRAQKTGTPAPAADGSRTIVGKIYFRSADGKWQELNGGK